MGIDELLKMIDTEQKPAEKAGAEVEVKAETDTTKVETEEPLLPIGDQFAEYCKSHTRK